MNVRSHVYMNYNQRYTYSNVSMAFRLTIVTDVSKDCCVFILGGVRNSVVSTGTRYGLSGLGFEFRWRRDFLNPLKQAQGPFLPRIQRVPSYFRGIQAGAWR